MLTQLVAISFHFNSENMKHETMAALRQAQWIRNANKIILAKTKS